MDDLLILGPRRHLPSWRLPRWGLPVWPLPALAVALVLAWFAVTAPSPVLAGHGTLAPPVVINPIPGKFLT